MANLEILALDTATPQIRAPGAGDGYVANRAATFNQNVNVFNATLGQVLSDIPTLTLRRFSNTQTSNILSIQTEASASLAFIDKDGSATLPTANLGVAGSIKGVLTLSGNTSGTVTVQPAAAAGTWALTLPTSAGTNGYVLSTNGSGVTSWVAQSGGGDSINPFMLMGG